MQQDEETPLLLASKPSGNYAEGKNDLKKKLVFKAVLLFLAGIAAVTFFQWSFREGNRTDQEYNLLLYSNVNDSRYYHWESLRINGKITTKDETDFTKSQEQENTERQVSASVIKRSADIDTKMQIEKIFSFGGSKTSSSNEFSDQNLYEKMSKSLETSLVKSSSSTTVDYGDDELGLLQKRVTLQFNDRTIPFVIEEKLYRKNKNLLVLLKNIFSIYNYDESIIELAMNYILVDDQMLENVSKYPVIKIDASWKDQYIDRFKILIYQFYCIWPKHDDYQYTANPRGNQVGYRWPFKKWVCLSAAADENWVPLYEFYSDEGSQHFYSTDRAEGVSFNIDLGPLCYIATSNYNNKLNALKRYVKFTNDGFNHAHYYAVGEPDQTLVSPGYSVEGTIGWVYLISEL
jgi:hypothetical protein